jgi:hypothetical protein
MMMLKKPRRLLIIIIEQSQRGAAGRVEASPIGRSVEETLSLLPSTADRA